MRTREEILNLALTPHTLGESVTQGLILETLLDIRDLLLNEHLSQTETICPAPSTEEIERLIREASDH